jgi:N-methylhydantoinase A
MTTILDGYLKSTIQTWVANLEKELVERGFRGRVIITRSDGGGMTSDLAMMNPINTLFSGPSGGVTGGMFLANNLDHQNLVTLDMGGTSCDICIIRDGRAMMKQEAIINEWRVLLSTMSINTVGAGGGTIAWIGEEGALRVGPQSAGANPGPICCKKGGTEPTITDAALSNGYIDPGYFLGGEIDLDKEKARSGIMNKIGKPLNMDLAMASSGILRIAISNMVNAIKEITINQGEDPRDFKLLSYGGAGPLFGAYLISELEMPSVIVPVAPANFSAWGMLTINIRHDFSLTVAESMDTLNLEEINRKLEELVTKGDETLGSENVPNNDRVMSKSLDMRYAKQEHTVNVPVDFPIDKDSQEKIYKEFTKVYQHVWGYSLEQPAAIVHLRVTAIGKVPKPRLREIATGNGNPKVALKGSREVLNAMDRTFDNYQVYERSKLLAHDFINGPALIEEPTTVSNVPQGYQCEVDKVGNLVIARKGTLNE